MKKIAILTVTGDNNYGNKLQNYALQKTLYEMGMESETVRIEKISYNRIVILTYIQKLFRMFLPDKKKKIIDRRICFFKFNQKINQHKTIIHSNDASESIKAKLNSFDFILYGSDQIWNPDLPQYSDIFWGNYAPKEKNISISASIGRSTIPPKYYSEFCSGIKNFKAISVREETAKELIHHMSDRINPAVLIDPTLMIDCQSWISIENKVDSPEKYCVTYYLGNESMKFVNNIAEEKQCEIMDIGPSEPYGPGEFIYLIRNSNAVITDSFHASVFSILFGKELYIIQRKDQYASMNSRIDTLLNKLGIVPELIDSILHIKKNAIYDKNVQKIINDEKCRFVSFLAENLK